MKNKLIINHSSFIIGKSKGFTLIELMVVLSITAILGMLGIAGFTTYNEVQILQGAASELATTLNVAKSRALSQVKLGSACDLDSRILNGYSVQVKIVNKSYTLNSHCSVGSTLFESILDTRTLPKNITFENDSSTTFFFPIITGGVEIPGQVILKGYGRSIIINVSSLGAVSIQDE